MNLSFQKLFYAIATAFLLFAILVFAKPILIPLGFALLISFILYPIVKKVESWGIKTLLAALLSIFALILIIGGGIFLFSTQIIELSKEFPHFQDKIILAFAEVTLYINKNVNFIPNLEKSELSDRFKNLLNESMGSLVKQTFSNTATVLTGLLATIIFTFLILINRKGLTKAFSWFSPEDKRERVVKMFKSVQQVGQKYFFGMILIILILGVVNSVGLWIIGIDNPFLFGILAAFLALIPYAGTFLGATIPIVYSLISYQSFWMPITIAIFFWFVQFIEGNFLTPKIVGGNININSLTAILSLIVGAVVWGIAGMILFLPFAAMLKIVCENYEELKPIALIIGENKSKKSYGLVQFISRWWGKIKGGFRNN